MVQRRAARFVKGRYGMFESVTQMLEMDSAIKKTRKQSSHSLLQNYQQFGCGTTFMSGKGCRKLSVRSVRNIALNQIITL